MLNGICIAFFRYEGMDRKETYNFRKQKWVAYGEHGPIDEACHLALNDDDDLAQKLADALYERGFMPKVHVPSKTELDAKEMHIADLRVVTTKLLDIMAVK